MFPLWIEVSGILRQARPLLLLWTMNAISSRTTHHTKARLNFAVPHSLPGSSTWWDKQLRCAVWVLLKFAQILMHHIRNSLPDIKAAISSKLQKANAELATLGGPMADGNSGNIVLSVITEFTSEFRTTIDGNTNDLSLNELSGGARISFVFHELFNNGIKSIDPFDQVKDGDIRTILYNSSVSRTTVFYLCFRQNA